MRRSFLTVFVFLAFFAALTVSGATAMPMLGGWSDNGEKSPAVAALLSLIPVPVAIGQFYAGDWKTGLVFSLVETAEMATMAGVALYEGGSMMHYGAPVRDWDATGQTVFFSALGSFVLTKFVDSLTAALIADAHNKSLPVADVSLVLGSRKVGLSFGFRY